MELFTIGLGKFSENDVKEAARALTGWNYDGNRIFEIARWHDDGDKTILGKTGKWNGSDLVKLLLEHPATAERLTTKLCRQFFGESVVEPEAIKALAAGLRENDLNIGWAVGAILKSERFWRMPTLANAS